MIHLFLEQINKKYLEIILDNFGCNYFISNLALLKYNKTLKFDVSNQDVVKIKQGYNKIESISIVLYPIVHIANTDYNIKCTLISLHEIEIGLTLEGTQELQYILEYVRDNNEHFHLFGGFNLYTEEEDYSSTNLLDSITVYNASNY